MIKVKAFAQPDEWTVRRVGVTLALLASLVAVIGYLSQHADLSLGLFLSHLTADFYANVSTELGSIAITVLIIDSLNQRRMTRQEKAELVLQMSSPDNAFAQEAVRRLRARGWLKDGSLYGADLRWANLRRAYLWSANLEGVDLDQADLTGAYLEKANLRSARNLSNEQLAEIRNLRRAILPDGSRYDGRFNLEGDLSLARREDVSIDDPVAIAGWYGVSLKEYQRGQEWARENLPKLRSRGRRGMRESAVEQSVCTSNQESTGHPILTLGLIIIAVTLVSRLWRERYRRIRAA